MVHADHFATALATALTIVWNSEQDRYVVAGMTCRRAGRAYEATVFVCRSQIIDRRTGETRSFRGLIQPDGTALETSLDEDF
ncbi:MAG TPA: hypothetical protein VGL76_04090 [Gaiellaceae bacterium]|jgi:predicted butyrate kinase (DUF1464 family)